MDSARAERMHRELQGHSVGGWVVAEKLGAGKSAVVFRAQRDGQSAALKVFDPDLVERYGEATQLARIQRECSLIGQRHDHLVQIFDGGKCDATGYLFVAMEAIDGSNLASLIPTFPRDHVRDVIQSVASAARFLEDRGMAHRDIKPENIVVTADLSRTVLLDLGVLRPFGDGSITDADAHIFIGTLQYASPEFLHRQEADTPAGWRGLTFYQIGAVLHDLIMREPIFAQFTEPFATLVEAVKTETPHISASDVPPDFVLLAQKCLVKSPEVRLSLVGWEDFALAVPDVSPVIAAKERVAMRGIVARSQQPPSRTASDLSVHAATKRLIEHVADTLRLEAVSSRRLPPVTVDRVVRGDTGAVGVRFNASSEHSLPRKLQVRYECKLLDAKELAVSVAVCWCMSATVDPMAGLASQATELYKGPLSSSILTSTLQESLWLVVDRAQSLTASAETAADVSWHTLTDEGASQQ